jgi:cytochrome c-type biogenesis protein CcmH
MTLWIVLAVMTGAAVMTVLWPLSRRFTARQAGNPDIRFYHDQIAEIDRDSERGLLSAAEIEAVRAEAGRRLLRAASLPAVVEATGEPALRRRRAAAALGLSLVPLVAVGLYGELGSPHLPGQPLAARRDADPARLDLAAALAQIEAHLERRPDDLRGWDVVAPIYLRVGRPADAARAYASALRLGGDDAARLSGEGEALTAQAGGVVTAPARASFERALALEPDSPKPHFYLGLAAEQDSDAPRARRHYAAVLAATPNDAPWLPVLREKLARLGDTPSAVPAAALAEREASPAIRAMVEGLARRLAEQGGSAEEWERLIRSHVVLGQRDQAAEALEQALRALETDAGGRQRVAGFARDLGLDRGPASGTASAGTASAGTTSGGTAP